MEHDKMIYCAIKYVSAIGLCGLMVLTLLNYKAESSTSDLIYAWSVCGISVFAAIACLKSKLTFSLLDGVVLVWAAYMVINYYLVCEIPAQSKFDDLVLLMIIYCSVRVLFSVDKRLETVFLVVLILCGCYETMFGLGQLYSFNTSGNGRFLVTGTFFNPGPYSGYIVTILSVATAYYFSCKKEGLSVRKWLSAACIVLSLLVLPATLSRAAFVAYITVVLLLVIFLKRIKYIVPIFLTLIAGALLLYYFKQGSADARVLMTHISLENLWKHGFWGVGLGGFAQSYAEGQAIFFEQNPTSIFLSVAGCPEYAFNEFLAIGVEQGFVGLALYCVVLFMCFLAFFRQKSPLFYGLIALVVFSCFSYPFSLKPFQVLFVIFVAMAAPQYNKSLSINKWCCFAGMLLLSYLAWCKVGDVERRLEAFKAFRTMDGIYNHISRKSEVEDYRTLAPELSDSPHFWFSYGKSLNRLGLYNESNAALAEGLKVSCDPMFYNVIGNNFKAMKVYSLADSAYNLAFKTLPNRIYPLYLQMKLHIAAGNNEKTLQKAKEVAAFRPKVESPATNDIRSEAQKIITNYEDKK